MRVSGVYKDSLDRQVMEKVQIQNFKGACPDEQEDEAWGSKDRKDQIQTMGKYSVENVMEVPPTHCLPGRGGGYTRAGGGLGVLGEKGSGLFLKQDRARKSRGGDLAYGLQQNNVFVCLLVFFS